jgi:arylsulfatase A-like enzyme
VNNHPGAPAVATGPQFPLNGTMFTPLLAALAALAAQAEGRPPPSSAPAPDILIILADDLGYSDLGCYGGEIPTPNLDRLAENGLRLTEFTTTARCWPSRAALLTGYHAQAVRRDGFPGADFHGVTGRRPSWAKLLPERLKAAGYRSYLSGKWHVDGQPLSNGFDRAYTVDDHDRHFGPHQRSLDGKPLPTPEPGYYASTSIADHAIRFTRDHAADHPGRPLLGYVCFTAPHFPLQAPAEDIARHARRYLDGWEAIRAARLARQQELGLGLGDPSRVERELEGPYPVAPSALAKLGPGELTRTPPWESLDAGQRSFQAAKMAVHAAMVERMDREIGRIVEELRRLGRLENTLILFLSDNGASSELLVRGGGHDPSAAPGSAESFLCLGPGWASVANTPFRRHKSWVHEGGISTPLIAHWPAGMAGRGLIRKGTGHLVDLAPTLLELARADAARPADEPAMHGRSLARLLRAGEEPGPRRLWWLHEGNAAYRDGDWKIVRARGAPWSLHHLPTDRAEEVDLAAREPARLRQLAQAWEDELRAHIRLAMPTEPSPSSGTSR